MTTYTDTESVHCVTIKRTFDAPAKRVFNAWTQAELLIQWFGPNGFVVSQAMMDARVGGKYQIAIISPEGQTVKHHGEYVLYNPYTDLVFTWVLDGQECSGSKELCVDTLVSISLKEVGDTTELLLTHERLPDREAKEGHTFGWNSCLDSLAELMTQAH